MRAKAGVSMIFPSGSAFLALPETHNVSQSYLHVVVPSLHIRPYTWGPFSRGGGRIRYSLVDLGAGGVEQPLIKTTKVEARMKDVCFVN